MKACPHCGFHNTDARERCLKCGAILEHDWGAAQQNVHLRRLPLYRLRAALAGVGFALVRNLRFPVPEDLPYRHPWQAGFLSLLPGLGQIYNRQPAKAALFFLVFVVLAAVVVATILHPTSYLWIAALVAWILLAFNDALVTATKINGQEWTRSYIIAAYSALFFYLGLFWSLSQFFLIGGLIVLILYAAYSLFWLRGQVSRAKILTVLGVSGGILVAATVLNPRGNPVLHRWVYWPSDVLAPAIQSGDFIYVDAVTYWFRPPRLGEIVYYDPRRYTIQQGDNTYAVNISNALERVVALPGDRFERRDGRFFRNGREVAPAFAPLHSQGLPGGIDMTVPEGHYLVFISYGPKESLFGNQAPAPNEGVSPNWGEACFVARREMLGRALFIWHPIPRRQWLTP